MAMKNPCAKTVKPEQAHEVWQVANHPEYGGTWTWYVLKKYQSLEKEEANPHARWFCMVTSPYTSQRGDWGDTYVATIKGTGAVQLSWNPLVQTSGGEYETLNRGAETAASATLFTAARTRPARDL